MQLLVAGFKGKSRPKLGVEPTFHACKGPSADVKRANECDEICGIPRTLWNMRTVVAAVSSRTCKRLIAAGTAEFMRFSSHPIALALALALALGISLTRSQSTTRRINEQHLAVFYFPSSLLPIL